MPATALWIFVGVMEITAIACSLSAESELPRVNCRKEGRKLWYKCWYINDWRRDKLPIRPPRLRSLTQSQARDLEESAGNSSTEESMATPAPQIEYVDNNWADSSQHSPSESRLSLIWIRIRNPPREQHLASLQRSTTVRSTVRPMPKLLLPRPTRPAMYSLNGYIPTPAFSQRVRIGSSGQQSHYHLNPHFAASNKVSVVREFANSVPKRFISNRSKTRSSNAREPKLGTPGMDYPIYHTVPQTRFHCPTHSSPGVYADIDTGCQVWHICGGGEVPKYSSLCPNRTVFNEEKQACDWWYHVDCHNDSVMKISRRFGRDDIKTPVSVSSAFAGRFKRKPLF